MRWEGFFSWLAFTHQTKLFHPDYQHLCNPDNHLLILINIPRYKSLFCNWFQDLFVQQTKHEAYEQLIRKPNTRNMQLDQVPSKLNQNSWKLIIQLKFDQNCSNLVNFGPILWFQKSIPKWMPKSIIKKDLGGEKYGFNLVQGRTRGSLLSKQHLFCPIFNAAWLLQWRRSWNR